MVFFSNCHSTIVEIDVFSPFVVYYGLFSIENVCFFTQSNPSYFSEEKKIFLNRIHKKFELKFASFHNFAFYPIAHMSHLQLLLLLLLFRFSSKLARMDKLNFHIYYITPNNITEFFFQFNSTYFNTWLLYLSFFFSFFLSGLAFGPWFRVSKY